MKTGMEISKGRYIYNIFIIVIYNSKTNTIFIIVSIFTYL